VGINVNQQLFDFSTVLQATVSSLRTALADQPLDRVQLLVSFIQAMEYWLQQYQTHGFAPIRQQWCAWNVSLGQSVRLTTANGVIEGIAESIDDIGAIIIRTADGQRLKNYSGDLELMPAP
jgi:BirA family biotin operon repressor/biotin-[acetyl-CoA-carboxylase] ligase